MGRERIPPSQNVLNGPGSVAILAQAIYLNFDVPSPLELGFISTIWHTSSLLLLCVGAESMSACEKDLLTLKTAGAARDAQALMRKWWEASRPKKGGSVPAEPEGAAIDFPGLLHRWLEMRGLTDYLERIEDQKDWQCYRCVKTPLTAEQEKWTVAYHGTRWYALWLLLSTGAMLESDNKASGHDFWEPGVYCTPVLATAK